MPGPFINLFEGNRSLGRYDLPGELLGVQGRRFRLTRARPGGSNGVVFEAKPLNHLSSTPPVCAVKILRQRDSSRMDRFQNEVRILRALDHPNITRYFDSGELSVEAMMIPWVAMELGSDNLRRWVDANGPISGPSLKLVAIDMCNALSHLHSKDLIHRDVKPENFVVANRSPMSIKMIDFGLAKYSGEDVAGRAMDEFTQQGESVGPRFFFSPELIAYSTDHAHPVDRRSDLFQLGRILWFLATTVVSTGVPSRRANPFAPAFYDLVLSLVNDAPEDRPTTAQEVADTLASLPW
jgi:serine/threonine protein kinase